MAQRGWIRNYNKTDVKTYVGDGFTIYEENGKYEIGNPPFSATTEQAENRLKSEGVRVIQTKNGIRKEKYYDKKIKFAYR